MKRKLAKVVTVDTVSPIEGADKIEVVSIQGWKVVTSKGEFHDGDKCVMFEIDSYLPSDDERYSFIAERCTKVIKAKDGTELDKGIKISTVKLRGVISQGLVMPLDKFPEIKERIVHKIIGDDNTAWFVNPQHGDEEPFEQELVGADVTSLLRVRHYDEVAEALRPETSGNPVAADAMGKFPSDYIPKTDEERIQNLGEYFSTMKGRKFEVTEKNDGSSVTMFYSPTIDTANPFGVCSRNLRLKPKTENGVVPVPWKMADKYDAEVKIRAANISCGSELAFQGELVGPGVNGNRDLYKEYEWHVFKVWDITKQEFLLPSEARFICNSVGFVYVPVICEEMSVFDELDTVDALLSFAEGKTANGHEREGLVFKSVDRPYRSFKAVSNRYLMKEQE